MVTPRELLAAPDRRRLWTALADAIGIILLADAALSLASGRMSIGGVFFHVPRWLPLARFVPGAIGAAVLLRYRPVIVAGMALAVFNAFEYFHLRGVGVIVGLPVSFSALLAMAMLPAVRFRRVAHPAAISVAATALLLGHLLTFGGTDYRRPAEAIVVFGAKAHSPRLCSEVLADRTLTGVELYHQGCADTLILSGGGFEPDAMKRLAMGRGVPASAIICDYDGVNTAATLAPLPGRYERILAVSNYYHNARIKMAANRLGLQCYTVPAKMRRRLPAEPKWVLRECVAYAAYYLGLRST